MAPFLPDSLRPPQKQRNHTSSLLLCFLLTLLLFHETHGSLSVLVPAGSEECFVVPAAPHQGTVSGNFDCLDDELDPSPVSVVLVKHRRTTTTIHHHGAKPHKHPVVLWQSTPHVREEVFDIALPQDDETDKTLQRLELCFRNGIVSSSTTTTQQQQEQYDSMDRMIGFNVRVELPPRSLDEPGPDEERALRLVSDAASLQSQWDTLMDHYAYLLTREEQHMLLLQGIYKRVMQFTILEAVVLTAIAAGQVLYLRKFLEKTAYL